jgi:hypothetical protein
MTATGIPTLSPIFAPLGRPPDGRGGESVVEGDADGFIVAVTEAVCGVEDIIAVARASTAESDDCHMMGMPSLTMTVLEVMYVDVVDGTNDAPSIEYEFNMRT